LLAEPLKPSSSLAKTDSRRGATSALWPAFWLAVALVGAKGTHWGWPHSPEYPLTDWLRDWMIGAYQDVLFAVGFGVVSALALRSVSRWRGLGVHVYRVVVAAGAFCAFYAVVAVKAFDFLRSPLTYPLLYLAGGLRDMRSSIQGEGNPLAFAAMACVPACYVLAVWLTRRHVTLGRWTRWRVVLPVALALAAYAIGAHGAAQGRWADRGDALIVRSPHWAFLASLVDLARGSGVPAMDGEFPDEYLADFRPAPLAPDAAVALGPAPRNVIVVVLESTPARYTSLYGGPYRTTPMLEREAAHAAVFDAHYTPVGLTANVLVALHLSIYPYMTWREYTLEYPDYPGTTLAQMLGARGSRTLFIHTGHLEYTNQDGFLASRGYDQVLDWDKLGAGPAVSSWGGDDRVLVDQLLAWVGRDRTRPFCAVAWTINSHHPYEPVPGQPLVDFFSGLPSLPPDDYDLGRYLNTVQETDRQIGRLFDGLRALGLADETLVVVTGDHGQGFGWPHPTWGHGFRVYDENVRVPLMIWNPRLFPAGRRSAVVTSHVDINPTVADLMGLPAAPGWQGRSVFAAKRPPRAYFYAANDRYLLGVREANWKYIYNATRGSEELFELASDPDEVTNVAPAQAERCRVLRQRLAAWKSFVSGELARVRDAAPPARGR
jgi:lipoteichoic acid synthase